ncbi:hypothetical protein [Corynebacterium pseudogenitalium]|uniref:Uncharacterized protein n=1 Tax=Corynebacterium pseudogenitalium TaxID=38303 RepID=A0ABD4TU09_9CORY|nr:hypothetical protein [Corynebacterium pseudogenitalium]MCQ4614806.1 hypothetical protein [Corynebacterium pseudogenitalium]
MTNLPLTQRLALTEAWQTPVSASSNWTPRLGWWVARSTVQPGGGGGVDSLEGVRDRNVGGAQCA